MPKIYEYLGLIFYFYSGEHLPVHVHVRKAECEMKFELIYEKGVLTRIDVRKVKGKEILKSSDIALTIDFIKEHADGIVTKWNQFFIFGVKPSVEKINKKK
ncbi:MAG: DUF4160 domain-containing protein [Bacteroidetes bacterium]|nr:DUF4160 domain-containing protein [Bacteroidota bacterium]